MTRILKKLKHGYKNNIKLFGFDVETYQFQKDDHIEQRFMMGSVVGHEFQKVFWDKQEMSDFLSKSKVTKDSQVYATHLDFDFRHAVQGTDNFKDFNKITINGKTKFAKRKVKNHSWVLSDTMNFAGLSVEKIGKLLKVPKLEHPECFLRKPKTRSERNEMERYNIRDSEVSYLFACYLQDFFNKQGCRMKITIASTGLDYWRRYGQPFDLFPERYEWVLHHYKGSFRGGRTEVFKRGYAEDIFYYDYNSHYPAMCYQGIDGKGSYPNPSTSKFIERCDEDIIKDFEGITDVTMTCPDKYIPLIGVKLQNKKLVFPKGEITGWLTNIEIRKALKDGYELTDCRNGIYYTETFIPFRKVVKTLYEQRKELKKNKDPSQLMVKTQMNSGIFGKFCQKLDGFEEELHESNIFCDDDGNLGYYKNTKFTPIIDYIQRGECFYVKKENTKVPLFTMPILSSYTTAMGRIKITEDMRKYQKYLLYGDTDSMFLLKDCFKGSNELGDLKLECEISKAMFVRPKMYYYEEKDSNMCYKTKGIGRAIDSKEKWDNLINNKKARISRFTKYKESCIRGIGYSSIIEFDKNVSLEDDKRDWDGLFRKTILQDSRPFTMKEGLRLSDYEKLQQKALIESQRQEELERKRFINSDLFDSEAVGSDISEEEFLENEKWFARFEE